MYKLKQYIEKRKEILYEGMDNDDYVSPDMLDNALSVINAQNKYIDELEKELNNKKCTETNDEGIKRLIHKCIICSFREVVDIGELKKDGRRCPSCGGYIIPVPIFEG
ncbi:MAG: hypothetical protein ACRCXT_23015 [Paraclostridium sp.]